MNKRASQIQLSRFTKKHARNTLHWVNDPELMTLLNRATTVTEPNHRQWFKRITNTVRIFAIIVGRKHIGNCCLFDINRDSRSQKADLWIYIGDKSERGKGYGEKAMRLLLDFGFQKIKLHKICLYVMAYNRKAFGLYKKLGFRYEGRRVKDVFLNGAYHDTIHMGILEKDWADSQE